MSCAITMCLPGRLGWTKYVGGYKLCINAGWSEWTGSSHRAYSYEVNKTTTNNQRASSSRWQSMRGQQLVGVGGRRWALIELFYGLLPCSTVSHPASPVQ